ncbi:MAG: hypothetical protein HPY60_09625 [Candidatus Methanofastidiosum sp.]|nr:hypothetical protein [Methanofastidiosum sp.]
MARVSCGEFVIETRDKFDSNLFERALKNIKEFEENLEKIEEMPLTIWKQKFNI